MEMKKKKAIYQVTFPQLDAYGIVKEEPLYLGMDGEDYVLTTSEAQAVTFESRQAAANATIALIATGRIEELEDV